MPVAIPNNQKVTPWMPQFSAQDVNTPRAGTVWRGRRSGRSPTENIGGAPHQTADPLTSSARAPCNAYSAPRCSGSCDGDRRCGCSTCPIAPSHSLIMTLVPTSTDNVLATSYLVHFSLLTSFTFIYPGCDDEVRATATKHHSLCFGGHESFLCLASAFASLLF